MPNHQTIIADTWLGCVPSYVALLTSPDIPEKTKAWVEEELRRMAQAADAWNIVAREVDRFGASK